MHAGTLKAIVTTVVQAGLVLALMVSAVSEVWTQRAAGPAPAAGRGGAPPLGVPRAPLGDGPWVLDTAEQHKIKVSIVASGLVNPWSLAWLPDGSMLITERPGRLRLLKNGVLDPTPIAGVPAVKAQGCPG